MATDLGINPKLPTWDGDWRTFSDYRLAAQLEFDGLKDDDQKTLAPRLARNLTGKAWEACLDINRESLRKADGLDYLLKFLKQKRGKQQVDMLGEAFEKYFQSNEIVRQDRENLNDYEQRLTVFTRDIERALSEIDSNVKVPTEIYGWFLLNKHLRLDPSDVATLKSQTASYKLVDVMSALRKMWGGDSLTQKDQERRRAGNRAYLAADYDDEDKGSAWWNEAEEDDEPELDEDELPHESEIWFEEATQALVEQPTDEQVLANFQDAKKAFYKDARRALDQSRTSRGYFPPKGKGKGRDSGSGKGRESGSGRFEFKGKCMRCGKVGHKAQSCPQRGSDQPARKNGSGVGFVGFVYHAQTTTPETTHSTPTWTVTEHAGEDMTKAILDCGASESIVGALSLQQYTDELEELGFDPSSEIEFNTRFRKSFVFGNNETSLSLGHASVPVGVHGVEKSLDMHVVEGQTPFLLSSKWLHEQRAVVDFGTAQALFPMISEDIIQLERSATHHLLLPLTAFEGHDAARKLTQVDPDQVSLLLGPRAQVPVHCTDTAVSHAE